MAIQRVGACLQSQLALYLYTGVQGHPLYQNPPRITKSTLEQKVVASAYSYAIVKV